MTIATAYVLGATRSYPIMQLDLKENIQNATNGKVYVRLAPGGQLGSEGELVSGVQNGAIPMRAALACQLCAFCACHGPDQPSLSVRVEPAFRETL